MSRGKGVVGSEPMDYGSAIGFLQKARDSGRTKRECDLFLVGQNPWPNHNFKLLHPEIHLSLEVAGVPYGPFDDDAYSPVHSADGRRVPIDGALKYKIRFLIPDKEFDSILLATPVLDDVTIFYTPPGPRYECYYTE